MFAMTLSRFQMPDDLATEQRTAELTQRLRQSSWRVYVLLVVAAGLALLLPWLGMSL